MQKQASNLSPVISSVFKLSDMQSPVALHEMKTMVPATVVAGASITKLSKKMVPDANVEHPALRRLAHAVLGMSND